ncbi:MAG: hypothetical protein ACRCZF_14650 [Gemmataceae bacterium]
MWIVLLISLLNAEKSALLRGRPSPTLSWIPALSTPNLLGEPAEQLSHHERMRIELIQVFQESLRVFKTGIPRGYFSIWKELSKPASSERERRINAELKHLADLRKSVTSTEEMIAALRREAVNEQFSQQQSELRKEQGELRKARSIVEWVDSPDSVSLHFVPEGRSRKISEGALPARGAS